MEELTTKIKRGEWFMTDNIFIDKFASKIGNKAALIYICINRHANEEGYCWPTHKAIAGKLGISTRTVIRNIKVLEDYNLIICKKTRRYGTWANYSYTITDRDDWVIDPYAKKSHTDIVNIALEPYDKKSAGYVTKATLPDDKNNILHMTQSHINNTNNINTCIQKTNEKFTFLNKEEKIQNSKDEQTEVILKRRYRLLSPKEFAKSLRDQPPPPALRL